VWFDQLELQRLDEPQEQDGEALLDIARDPNVAVDQAQKRRCPKCDDIVMMRFCYSPKRRVTVDHCGECGGFWLDAGELRTIRSEYGSAVERTTELEAIFADRFGDDLAAMERERAAAAKGFRPISRVVGFLFPGLA
jgi:Zn-finger nucleic acid-binding protein